MITPFLRQRAGASAAALLLLLVFTGMTGNTAHAAARFSAEPLLLKLPADKLATSLSLGNRGESAVTVQAELVSWDQRDGEDRYEPVDDLIVSPPIFSLAPGATQIVRVGRLQRGEAPASEIAYRLRLAEIAPEGSLRQGAVATVMQLSFPVFVAPATKNELPQLDVRPHAVSATDLDVRVGNNGKVHGKITRLAVMQDGKLLSERTLNWYVLSASKRTYRWAGALAGARAKATELQVTFGNRKTLILPIAMDAGSAAASEAH